MIKKFLQLSVLILSVLGFTTTAFAQSIQLNVPLPGGGAGGATLTEASDIGPYVNAIFTFGTGFVISLSIVMIMIAGVRWLTSAGNASRVEAAKNDIITYIIGLVIAMFSYYILYIINPELTILRSPAPTAIERGEDVEIGELGQLTYPDENKDCTDKGDCLSGICYEFADGVDDNKGKCVSTLKEGDICESANIDRYVVGGVGGGLGIDDDITCPTPLSCKETFGHGTATCIGTDIGATCYDSKQCASGVCWDYADTKLDGVGKCIDAVGPLGICGLANVGNGGTANRNAPCQTGFVCSTPPEVFGPNKCVAP